ncbi:hypothetical protein FB446DRAFT_756633 [Lentinula raphanica]|nr:hypothetical protein FB446DRAFT_756633 [Lentinula raphanica]
MRPNFVWLGPLWLSLIASVSLAAPVLVSRKPIGHDGEYDTIVYSAYTVQYTNDFFTENKFFREMVEQDAKQHFQVRDKVNFEKKNGIDKQKYKLQLTTTQFGRLSAKEKELKVQFDNIWIEPGRKKFQS